jgi:thymidine phosphorylase
VATGDLLATVLANDEARGEEARRRVLAAYRLAESGPAPRPLIHEVIGDRPSAVPD